MWQRQIHFAFWNRCRRRSRTGGSRRAAGRGRRRSPSRPRAAASCRAHARGTCAASPRVHSTSRALEPVVGLLGDGEELVASLEHLPLGFHADAAQQRHVGGEELGDAAAVRGGVEVEDPGALQRLGQRVDAVDDVGRRRCRGSGRAPFRGAGRARAWADRYRVGPRSCGSRGCVTRPIYRPCPSQPWLQTSSEEPCLHLTRPTRWRGACEPPGSTRCGCCRSPTAAKARSTRCSPRSVGRGAPHASPGRSAAGSTPSGGCCPTARQWSRPRRRAGSRW